MSWNSLRHNGFCLLQALAWPDSAVRNRQTSQAPEFGQTSRRPVEESWSFRY